MAKLTWASTEVPLYENGVSKGVIHFADGTTKTWVGLISISDSPEFEASEVFFEGRYVANSRTHEVLTASIECFTYPPDILSKPVQALTYETDHGSGYQVHVIYNPIFLLPSKTYSTYGDDIEISTLSLEMKTTPVKLEGYAPSAHLVLDSTRDDGTGGFQIILDSLYGSPAREPYMLDPDLLVAVAIDPTRLDLEIIDNGDGTITYIGGNIQLGASGTFTVDHIRIRLISADEFGATLS